MNKKNSLTLKKIWLIPMVTLLTACYVNPPPSPHKLLYVDIPCELPSGVPSTCRVAEWQQSYWEDGRWHPLLWQPHYWLFTKTCAKNS